MYVAIGMDGARRDPQPVVWGVGETVEAAIAEAREYSSEDGPLWNRSGAAILRVSDAIAKRIQSGEVECTSLGIRVIKSRGRISGAEMERSAGHGTGGGA